MASNRDFLKKEGTPLLSAHRIMGADLNGGPTKTAEENISGSLLIADRAINDPIESFGK
jgi:hypothetical protein